MRERGLKPFLGYQLIHFRVSLPVRERGLKHLSAPKHGRTNRVAPRAGAWIETATQERSRGTDEPRRSPCGRWVASRGGNMAKKNFRTPEKAVGVHCVAWGVSRWHALLRSLGPRPSPRPRDAWHASRLSRKAQRFTVQIRMSREDMERHEYFRR